MKNIFCVKLININRIYTLQHFYIANILLILMTIVSYKFTHIFLRLLNIECEIKLILIASFNIRKHHYYFYRFFFNEKMELKSNFSNFIIT